MTACTPIWRGANVFVVAIAGVTKVEKGISDSVPVRDIFDLYLVFIEYFGQPKSYDTHPGDNNATG